MQVVSATTDLDLLDRLAVEIDHEAEPSDLDEVLAAFLIAHVTDDPLDPAAGSSFTTTGE